MEMEEFKNSEKEVQAMVVTVVHGNHRKDDPGRWHILDGGFGLVWLVAQRKCESSEHRK